MKYIFTIVAFIFSNSSTAADRTLDLSTMSDSDKNKTGLYKLSESEIKSLQQWLSTQHKTIQKEERQSNAGFELKEQSKRETIVATLEKFYKDPLGNTFYKLTNGQVWKQIQSGRMNLKNDGTQNITIEPMMMGSWLLKGDGNRGVKVKRIR
ncbi:hypothetical protein [Marinicella rhabdoformis]|uniref:hypothetical protein n=1 Tax=Marinicella rhabdoformis TaxID=2580566 RepID=UPI0012AEBB92|nr:hypothetical protein [Marinicella rhabdoformis]